MARDPKRIDEMLEVLGRVWKANPDLRLGQIVANASSGLPFGGDPFYLEDDRLLEYLRSLEVTNARET